MNVTKRLFYYSPQRIAVECDLRPILNSDVKLVPVTDAYHLQGYTNGAFVEVYDHPQRIPPDMREMLMARGFMRIILDDSYPRNLAYARMNKR